MINGQENTDEAKITQERGLFTEPGKTVIDAGKGDDMVNTHTNRDGSVDVTINGEKRSFSEAEAKNLEVRGGKGDDFITGGCGNDFVMGGDGNDHVYGDQGRDWVQGGSKEQNFIEKMFDMPSKKDSVNERSFLDTLLRGVRGQSARHLRQKSPA